MAGNVFINVSSKKESLDFYLKKQVKKLDAPIILCPGAEPIDSLKKLNVIYTKNFSYNWLYENLGEKTARDLIITDSHKIKDFQTIDGLISFAKQTALKIYFFGQTYDANGCVSPFIDYLAEIGYGINELDDYVVEEDLNKKITSDPDKLKYGYKKVNWQEVYKMKDERGKRGPAKLNVQDLFNTANDLHKKIKHKLVSNEKTK